MFWTRRQPPAGVALDDLQAMLESLQIKSRLRGNRLIARHGRLATRIEVVPASARPLASGQHGAVVRVVTDLPGSMPCWFRGHAAAVAATSNAYAALGAAYPCSGRVRIGSRLSVGAANSDWLSLHLPLLCFAASDAARAILAPLRIDTQPASPEVRASRWRGDELELAAAGVHGLRTSALSDQRIRVEFALDEADAPAHALASLELHTDQPHPELGAGLHCLLQLPHRIICRNRLDQVCAELNRAEMQIEELPPHFGAWRPGLCGSRPNYVSFLPNSMHSTGRLAPQVARWAGQRARWADARLTAMGYPR